MNTRLGQQRHRLPSWLETCALLALAMLPACAGGAGPNTARLDALLRDQQAQIEEQRQALAELREEVARLQPRAVLDEPAPVQELHRDTVVSSDELARARGTGPEPDSSAAPGQPAGGDEAHQAAQDAVEKAQQPGEDLAAQREKELEESIPARVGGVLLPQGRLQFEPQIRYSYSTSNRVDITGFTILPAITLGLVDAVRRDTSSFTAALGVRYGLLDRWEVDFGIPFVGGWSRFRFSALNTDPSRDAQLEATGYDIGDIRFGIRTQLNKGGAGTPVFVGGVAVRLPTGRSPYSLSRNGVNEQFIEKEIATGSGFYAVTPTLSFVYPSEPGVLFGNVRYTWNIEDQVDDIEPNTDVTIMEPFGKIDPGDMISASLGVGLSLNDHFSMLFSYDHSFVFKTRQNGSFVGGAVPLQIGTLGIGGTWRSSPRRSYNLVLGIGITDDAPDLGLSLRAPMNFDFFD